MKTNFLFLLYFLLNSSSYSQSVEIVKIEQLSKRIHNNSDSTYIVNFWATWCAPCVKELPFFDSISNVYTSKKVKTLLVSMDFKENLDSKLIPFISKKGVQSEVVLLDESNGNYFIPIISDEWTGSLPATLIVNDRRKAKRFFEQKVTVELLKNEIDEILEMDNDQE